MAMGQTTTFASLSPTLLARKGGAKPAMRPQLNVMRPSFDAAASLQPFDDSDLGWNDMGHDSADDHPGAAEGLAYDDDGMPESQTAEVVSINGLDGQSGAAMANQVPEIVRQQESVSRAVSAPPVRKPSAKVTATERRSALIEGRRAAFTLRLDADRHLQLRLACTVSNRSAQQILTDALDRLLSEMPEISALAAKVRKSR